MKQLKAFRVAQTDETAESLLRVFIVSPVFIRFDLPGLGDVCLAQSPADDLWHRVVYLGHPDVESDGDGDRRAHGLAIVHFVDLGFYVSKLLL